MLPMWDLELIRHEAETPGTAVFVSRRGLLLQRQGDGYRPVELTWVDEAALSLAAQALRTHTSIGLLYPAPAGELAALVAAQALVHLFLSGHHDARVGIVTANPRRIHRLWTRLAVVELGQVTPLEQWFRCLRAGADGTLPPIERVHRGLVVGTRRRSWPVHVTVFDHLNGAVEADGEPDLQIHLFADPLAQVVHEWVSSGRPLWGWSHGLLRSYGPPAPPRADHVPFSVANGRIRALESGCRVRIQPLLHEDAERRLTAILDDLRALGDAAGPSPPGHVVAGLKRAWGHAYALMSLPCRPSAYDRFCGQPPRAVAPTSEFADEIRKWARTLPGEMVEYALVLADDLDDLRESLDEHDVVLPAIREGISCDEPTLIVLRSRTAAEALWAALGVDLHDPAPAAPSVCWYRSLHGVESYRKALVIGPPPRSVWHMVDCGLAVETVVLVLGRSVAEWTTRALVALRERRGSFGGREMRERAWRALFGASPPPPPEPIPSEEPVEVEAVVVRSSSEDPFSPLRRLLLDDRPLIEEDGFEAVAVHDDTGRWSGLRDAIEVQTNEGVLLLPADGEVDVLDGGELKTCRVEQLRHGMQVVVSRDDARRRLFDALTHTIEEDRPDLRAARMVVELFKRRIQDGFSALRRAFGDLAVQEFCRRVRLAGSTKSDAAIRGWIEPDGPLGPRDLEDLRCLCRALSLPTDEDWLRASHAALVRMRGFRRALGRALSEAARQAVAANDSRVDPETGLSVADLREAVVVATVVAVGPQRRHVRATEVGRLMQVGDLS